MLVASLVIALGSASAFAQTPAGTVQRDVNQQTRTEDGLKDGSLAPRERRQFRIQTAENHQNHAVFNGKHNEHTSHHTK
jgi:hypothetical protein